MTSTATVGSETYTLNTTHASSSYNHPVLVGPDGTAYGTHDRLTVGGINSPAYIIATIAKPENAAQWMDMLSNFVPDLSDTFAGRES
jgi:hypothetical protein